jgi:hypothetical protein
MNIDAIGFEPWIENPDGWVLDENGVYVPVNDQATYRVTTTGSAYSSWLWLALAALAYLLTRKK